MQDTFETHIDDHTSSKRILCRIAHYKKIVLRMLCGEESVAGLLLHPVIHEAAFGSRIPETAILVAVEDLQVMESEQNTPTRPLTLHPCRFVQLDNKSSATRRRSRRGCVRNPQAINRRTGSDQTCPLSKPPDPFTCNRIAHRPPTNAKTEARYLF